MRKSLFKAAIIIVNWNGKKFLKNCFDAICNQTYKKFDVYFVDNGSTDGSIEYVKKIFDNIKIISLNKNYGFAKANNYGIKEAFKDKEVKYIVCLNNDTIVDENWLKELIKTAEKDKRIGMVSSKAYFIDGRIQDAGLSLEKGLHSSREGGIAVGFGLEDSNFRLKEEIELFVPGGVAPLYKRVMLEKLYAISKEYFDEDFFAYTEDLDIGFRGRLLGYKCLLSPQAKLIHLFSQTGGVGSSFKAYYLERNKFFTALKDLPLGKLLTFPYYNISLKLDYFLLKNSSFYKLKQQSGFRGMISILIKAYLSVFCNIPKMLLKRWKIQSNRKVSNEEINSWFDRYSREIIENEK
jgi:GT2 family glycosyltransferase